MTEFYLQKQDGSHALVSEAAFREVYGDFVIRKLTPDVPGWRIWRLIDKIDAPAGTSTYVLDENEKGPVVNWPVQMYYSTAPVRPGSAPPNGLPLGVTARGDVGRTGMAGQCGWGWDGDAYYWPKHDDPAKRKGPYAFWIPDGKPCEVIDGVGMIGETNHRRYTIYLMWMDGEGQVPTDPFEAIAWHLDSVARLVEGLA